MKCKIVWTETRCGDENADNSRCELYKRRGMCWDAREVQRGYEGDIQEYSIDTDSYCQNITIIVNKRRKIELCVDLYGEECCPCVYQNVTTFEIDGKPVKGYEREEEQNDQS